MKKILFLNFYGVLASMVIILTACGGGGGGGSGAAGAGSSPTLTAAISGLPGSTCTFKSNGGIRAYDLDESGHVSFYQGRIDCTLADGTKQTIAGLSSSAFTFTTNGATVSPEDMSVGNSGIDGKTTYTLEVYRHFASSTVAIAARATPESMSVIGQDSLGRTINFTQDVLGSQILLATDWFSSSTLPGYARGAGPLGAGRVMDSDGMGYTFTTYAVSIVMKGSGLADPNTVGACTTGAPVGTPVLDYVMNAPNTSGQTVKGRYCLFTGLTSFSYLLNGALQYTGWQWQTDGTKPTTLLVTGSSLVPASLNALRLPIYKVTSAVRYPQAPLPNFRAVEAGVPNSLNVIGPTQPVFDNTTNTYSSTIVSPMLVSLESTLGAFPN